MPRKNEQRYDEEEDYDYDPRYDRQMKYANESGKCCSWTKFCVFILFLGGALGAIFGLIDIEEIRGFFTGSSTSGGTDSGGGDTEVVDTTPYVFMQCVEGEECCNGFASNCDLRVNELMYATVHNANHDDILVPNHEAPLEGALEAGYRGLMLDVCYCTNAETQAMEITFCHGLCGLGTRDPLEVFSNIDDFLTANPTELLVIEFEISAGSPTTDQLWSVMKQDDGIKRKTYTHDGGEWPTLRENLAAGKQIIAFQHNGDAHVRIGSFFTYAVETPWTFSNVADVENTAYSCKFDRGSNGALEWYSVNNFVTATFGPSKSSADEINEKSFVEQRIADCENLTGLKPNLVSVDFWQRGDLPEVAQEENKKRRPKKRRNRFLSWLMG